MIEVTYYSITDEHNKNQITTETDTSDDLFEHFEVVGKALAKVDGKVLPSMLTVKKTIGTSNDFIVEFPLTDKLKRRFEAIPFNTRAQLVTIIMNIAEAAWLSEAKVLKYKPYNEDSNPEAEKGISKARHVVLSRDNLPDEIKRW